MADPPHRDARGMPSSARERRSWRTYAAAVVAVLAAIIIVQNSQSVDVEILFASISTPLVFALLIVFGLGALTGWLLPRVRRGRKRDES